MEENKVAQMTKHSKSTHVIDSASGGKGESMATETRLSRLETVIAIIALSVATWGCYTLYRDTMAILNDGNHNYYCEHCYYGGM